MPEIHTVTILMMFFELFSEPMPGVTDLVVETLSDEPQALTIKKLLLRKYFPDLCHLTLRLEAFELLWKKGIIHSLLDHKRPQPDRLNKGKLYELLVLDGNQARFDRMWKSDVGEQVKGLNISLREDGFEFL